MKVTIFPILTKHGMRYIVECETIFRKKRFSGRRLNQERIEIRDTRGDSIYVDRHYLTPQDAENDIRELLGTTQHISYWGAK